MHHNRVPILALLLCIAENIYSIEFTEHYYVFEIFENEPPGTVVGQVKASTAEPGQLTYSISTEVPDILEIDPVNGTIFTKVSFDREEKKSHNSYVEAVIKDGNVSGSANVRVFVEDQNDNAPQWIFPNNQNATNILIPYNGSAGPVAQYGSDTIYIPANAPDGMVIGYLRAEDRDSFENRRLSYQFAPNIHTWGPSNEYFSINKDGRILVDKEPGVYCDSVGSMAVLDVMVSDYGRPPLSNTAELYVMLYGCEDYLPEGKMLS